MNGSSSQSDIAYRCDTEGGSSGSPVLSRRTHKVIGLHHHGGCPNQGVRIDLVAVRIGSLLSSGPAVRAALRRARTVGVCPVSGPGTPIR
ncbi:hypothetical protein ALI22I_05830 [Saccharothrix sp. ALI-22-I]|uniref:trypsin-like serine peptidase n=1 Tax=Saccharothrix sp. ALI-22-I TaxID=1933778 RepID=UPI00097C1E32|nr:hypothetical protein [Saccharothrix sp. ALI-22-I]ONI92122.1 hypothetical protein ALI22I_05830 [Saccharothrix sp. ALI-22-I]